MLQTSFRQTLFYNWKKMENKQSSQQFSIQNTAKLNAVNGIKMKIVLSSSMRNVLHNREEN